MDAEDENDLRVRPKTQPTTSTVSLKNLNEMYHDLYPVARSGSSANAVSEMPIISTIVDDLV